MNNNNNKRFSVCGVLRKQDCISLLKDNMNYEELKLILQPNYSQLIRLMKSYTKKELQYLLYNASKIGIEKITTTIRQNAVNTEDEIEEHAEAFGGRKPAEEKKEVEKKEVEKKEVENIVKRENKDENEEEENEEEEEEEEEEPIKKITIGEPITITIDNETADDNKQTKENDIDYNKLNKTLEYKFVMDYLAEHNASEAEIKKYLNERRKTLCQYLYNKHSLDKSDTDKLSIKDLYSVCRKAKKLMCE